LRPSASPVAKISRTWATTSGGMTMILSKGTPLTDTGCGGASAGVADGSGVARGLGAAVLVGSGVTVGEGVHVGVAVGIAAGVGLGRPANGVGGAPPTPTRITCGVGTKPL